MSSELLTPDSEQTGRLARCEWANGDPLMVAYHDEEWGVPCHDDRDLFERLMLECFQAGLSWSTILKKRAHFRRAFDNWEAERIVAYGDEDIARLLADPGIVRNRLKVQSFAGGAPLVRAPRPPDLASIPARTAESDALSKDLKSWGFTFVGSTICYAFMQSVGLVDDHVAGCFRAIHAPSPGNHRVTS
jgi:DNA-3-methyladenine glycosylase I